MSHSYHSVEKLGPPFIVLDEILFVIPGSGSVHLPRSRFKILFILDGRVEHELDGIEGRHALGAGDILVVPGTGAHTYVNTGRAAVQMQMVRFFLDEGYLEKCRQKRTRRPEIALDDFILHHFTKSVQIRGGIDAEIAGLLTALRREAELRATGFRHRVRSIAAELIVAAARRLEETPKHSSPPGKSGPGLLVAAAKEYIFKHLTEDLTLGQIAWQVGKGEEHLARVFKRETGQSVFEHVREMRIYLAKTQLLNPRLSLTEIAENCGFHSLAFFSRTFKLHAGLSPSEYRKHLDPIVSSSITK